MWQGKWGSCEKYEKNSGAKCQTPFQTKQEIEVHAPNIILFNLQS